MANIRPFDLNVPVTELASAGKWWRSLSINQMKAMQTKYFPSQDWVSLGNRWIHQIWEDEGKPLSQVPIPINK